ncbi:MAG: serine hydrolase [Lachnospiraceae bacterium]|nr:serine hydrolase [Lachnospiraceae bacterium]
MKKHVLSILLAFCILTSLITPLSLTANAAGSDICSQFTDVSLNAWYHNGIHYVVSKSLMNGTANHKFSPNGNMTRGMFVTVLYRFDGAPDVYGHSDFTDVHDNAYYEKAVIWATNLGITAGTSDTTFSPDWDVSREQAVVLIYRYLQHRNATLATGGNMSRFPDAGDVSGYARKEMTWAIKTGMIAGCPDNGKVYIRPKAPASRAQVATMLKRMADVTRVTPITSKPKVNTTLQTNLTSRIRNYPGNWAVYVEQLNTGASIYAAKSSNFDQALVSASLIKLFVMGAVYEKIENGTIQKTTSVSNDLRDMIQISSNAACNRLVNLLGNNNRDRGLKAVNDFAARMGCPSTQMTRLMLENTGTQNYISAHDCAKILRMIYRGECVSKSASNEMLAIMKGTQKMYAANGLPSGVAFAHKTGSLTYQCFGDVGIVFASEPYIICIINNGSTIVEGTAKTKIEDISRYVYNQIG